jgi:hypothetical protein
VQLWVNGQLVDLTTGRPLIRPQTNSASITLKRPSNFTTSRWNYFQSTGNAVAAIALEQSFHPQAIIPQTQLYPFTNPPPSVVSDRADQRRDLHGRRQCHHQRRCRRAVQSVSHVAFYVNGSLLGTVSNAAYTH